MKHNSTVLLSILAAGAGTISTVCAQTPPPYFSYTEGNLILAFQATSGQGTSQNVFFNLGAATSFRDNGSQGVLGTIGATLAATYGPGWYARQDLWFGVIANLNHHPTSGIGSRAAVSGDPSRTFYTSIPASAPGAGPLAVAGTYQPAALGLAGNTLRGMEQMLRPANGDGTGWNLTSSNFAERGIYREPDISGILSLTIPQHAVAWNNSWVQWNPNPGAVAPPESETVPYDKPVPGPAVRVFTGGISNTAGIQQNFGKGGSATYVDVQRILATNTGAAPTGVVGGGTYETTISISSTGVITSLIPSPFTAWIDSFNPPLTNPSDRLLTADPDTDSATNLQEFGFGGNPTSGSDQGTLLAQTVDANGDTLGDITLTIEVRSGATFSPSGNDLLSGVIDELTYRIEGSIDLATWDSPVSEVIPHLGTGSPSTGYVFKTFRLNAGNGLGGKGFLRAIVVK
jgi:hypothetical protein